MDDDNSSDYKWFFADEPSLFWQCLSAIGWGVTFGIIAGFVILTLHLGR